MLDSLGQNSEVWDNWWDNVTPLSEIRMWDYFGGRQWITKYVPRFGKVIEAGCGVGRYVFYLRKLGIDIEGIDFSDEVIRQLKKIRDNIDQDAVFINGDILNMPYPDNSLSGYISLGVIEHFIEGPQAALKEAYNKLRPGGIAIITTPNKSFLVRYRNMKVVFKDMIKRFLRYKIIKPLFFQYEYTPKQLRKFITEAGFHVTRSEGCDFLFPFCDLGGFSGKNLTEGSFAYRFSHLFENSLLKYFAGQSVSISVKVAPKMHCFLTGKLTATPDSLKYFDVPISVEMQNTKLAQFYRKKSKVAYACKYKINPSVLKPEERRCDFTNECYMTDEIFEDFGFTKNVSPEALKRPEINIELCAKYIKPVWRPRVLANK